MASSAQLHKLLRSWSDEDLDLVIQNARHSAGVFDAYNPAVRYRVLAVALSERAMRQQAGSQLFDA